MAPQVRLLESSTSIRESLGAEVARIARLDPLARQRRATRAFRVRLLRGYGERCGYCHRRRKVEAAHIVPLEIGAMTNEENLILLCRSCHRFYDTGHLSIRSMMDVARDWRSKIIPVPLRSPIIPVSPTNAVLSPPPPAIASFLEELLPLQRLRHYKKAIEQIDGFRKNSTLGWPEYIYLSIKRAELTRRRAVVGAVASALDMLQELRPSTIPLVYQPLFYYELGYVHRLLGQHAKAAQWIGKSSQALKRRRCDVRYVAAATNEILCEMAARERPPQRTAMALDHRLRDLEMIAQRDGGFWGGRWVLNCAAAALHLKLKLDDATQAWQAAERLHELYFKWEVRSGWDLGARSSISQLDGMVRILFPRNTRDLQQGIGLLARSFMTRLAPRQRPEGIRDVGFALALALRRTGAGTGSTVVLLEDVMSRTIDGTSVQWPWRGRLST
jgi:tetratricopeptide (TPR) repeat protein